MTSAEVAVLTAARTHAHARAELARHCHLFAEHGGRRPWVHAAHVAAVRANVDTAAVLSDACLALVEEAG